ncbi:MAG: hypothetical protein JNK67_31815 [Alphaproteobacteria bacterium]|nr:hypothetical protein [Alphaproteobacteria bacterium]
MPVFARAIATAATASLLAAPLLAVATAPAAGFALIGTADLLVQPQNFYSFDGDEITWKFSDNFLAAFPNAQLHTQVRLAFGEWSSASASAERRDSPRYHWVRSDGARQVYDLRSAVTHEIGHTLGSQHPDAAWFNSSLNRNFRYDAGGDLIAAPPLGGEIMNEGFQPGTLPASKPPTGIAPGEYWRTVSKDELLFLDYVYGRRITFKEVAGNAPAQIIVTAYNLDGTSDSGALGQGGVDESDPRDPGDASKGRRITAASFTMNANPTASCATCSIGIDPSTGSWDVTNATGKAIDRLSIRGQGTSNREPLLVVLSNDPHNFTEYAPASTFELFNFENRGHIFSEPEGGEIPDGEGFGIAMQQDVWDWTATAATTRATDGEIIPLSLISFVPFYEFADATLAVAGTAPTGAILQQEASPGVVARGLKLVNSDTPTHVGGIGFADVEGLGIDAPDVLRRTWEELVRLGRTHELSFTPFEFGAGEEFYLVFEGDLDSLPREVRARGNYLLLDFPGLLDREIFAWARSDDGRFAVQSFGLVNDEPIVGIAAVPAPASAMLLAPGLAMVVLRRRGRVAPSRPH